MMKETQAVQLAIAFACIAAAITTSCATVNKGPAGNSRRDARAFYPASPGMVWAYDVETPDSRHSVFTVAKVISVRGDTAILEAGGERFTRLYDAQGVRKGGLRSYLLKEPIEAGRSWAIPPEGKATIVKTDARVTTPAGEFQGCVVVEERAGDIMVRKTLAPGVGPVLIQVFHITDGGRTEVLMNQARLRGFSAHPLM